jgi:hypothetical protein
MPTVRDPARRSCFVSYAMDGEPKLGVFFRRHPKWKAGADPAGILYDATNKDIAVGCRIYLRISVVRTCWC